MSALKRSTLHQFMLRNVSYVVNIMIIGFYLYVIYYYFFFFPKNIISVYALLIFIGYISYRLEHWISWPLYALHVFMLPGFLLLLRTYQIPYPIGPFIFLFSTFIMAIIGIFYYFNIRTNIFKNAVNDLLPDFMIMLFLLLGVNLPNLNAVSEKMRDIIILVFLFTFLTVSLSYLNRKFRKVILCRKYGTFNIEKLYAEYLTAFEQTFPGDKNDQDFILYYFQRALNSFVIGDFEDSFINAFKIVFDHEFKKIYKIKDYEKRRPYFRDVRAAIAHPKKKEIYEDVDGLKRFRKRLFEDTLELLIIMKSDFMDCIARI